MRYTIKKSQTITNEFSNILTTSKRSPVKIESDRGSEIYNNIFQIFPKTKKKYDINQDYR